MITVVILNKIKMGIGEQQTNNSSTIKEESLKSIYNHLIIKYRKRMKTIPTISSNSAYLTILLIMAGDIHPNPGPGHGVCIKCKDRTIEETAVTICETCNQWCHIQCISPNNDHLIEKSFEWICPNTQCAPTYQIASKQGITLTPNRYAVPTEDSEHLLNLNKQNPPENRRKNIILEKTTNENADRKLLFTNLPKISSKDYIGKDICRICNKTVGENHRAVSCDRCERWLHVKCTDMEGTTYNMLRKTSKFNWTCHECRESEILPTSRINIKNLKPEECPSTIEELSNVDEPLILGMNCRSIMNKVDEIKDICYNLKPMILCLSETWMDYSVPQNFITPDGYSIIRKDRTENFKQRYGKSNGGGIAILHKNNIKVKIKDIADKDDEILWIEIMTKKRLLVGLVYRATYTDLLKEDEESNCKLNKTLENANLISNNVILLGDINCDTSNTEQDSTTKILTDTCTAYQMTQLITKPTRVTENTRTTIDHIWTDVDQELITESGTFIGVSDHLGTYAKLNLNIDKKQNGKPKLKRNWRNYVESEYRETLSTCIEEADISELINNKDLNGSMNALTEAIQKALNQHAPLKEMKEKVKQKGTIPWFNQEIKDKKDEKNNLLKLYYLMGDLNDKAKAKKLNNDITHLKQKKKKAYYTNKLLEVEGDSKQTWKILKELTNGFSERKEIEPDTMNQEEANKYNIYFATVGSEIQKKLGVKDEKLYTKEDGFIFSAETEGNVMKLIERIRTNVAVGLDGINAKVLKDGKDIIAPTLTRIINLGYELNQFPDLLKIASIKPIHKKNCNNDPANYRPISILPMLSKVFERSAVDKLVTFLENNNLLSAAQHAYRKFHSTVTSLAELTNTIYRSLDEGKIVGLVSMDLSKAFDSISHSNLLQKLSNMGLQRRSVLWIESYLQSRKQKTCFKDITSEESEVTSGVPQGSILGPILFLCFTNDLTENFPEEKVISYADDSQFLVTGKSIEEVKTKLEKIIKKAEDWYKANSLMSNPSKTEVMIFSQNKNKKEKMPSITVYENGQEIELKISETLKILGVHIDKNMTWNEHVTKLRHKTNGIVRHLHRVNQLLPMKVKLQLYDSLVASHLNYADIIWSGCNSANKQKLQCVQNFALKSILGMNKYDSATEALKKLKYLNLEEKRKIHEGVFAHKVLTGKMPKNITEDYKKLKSYGNNRSAENGNLKIPKHKTTKYENSLLYRTVKTWNDTKANIRTETTSSFKKKLQATYTSAKFH